MSQRAVVRQGFTKTIKRYMLFLLVGAMNAAVDLLVFNLFFFIVPTRAVWALALYNTMAVLAAIANSYYWNKRWTFQAEATGSKKEKMLFLIQAGINLLINDLIVFWISRYLVFNKSIPLFASGNAAKILAMMLSSFISYLFMRYMVFRQPKRCTGS
ncbi:GtrA family protein [Alicyclobacillus tolerans]|uniref:Flippase GtrA n=2 Tax=Alicyclobacillus tolerans TaxID=90970 RepID=A0ABT9LXY9_9BACL|nr:MULTISPECIES: GtrA family protein [Alicyclobacillus]MDP9729124.1 putative flippase GtrA [Alicyclobacillus tengchongensis]QRF22716.1 GtrA family protein [Alicyclobacillus sp. TC]